MMGSRRSLPTLLTAIDYFRRPKGGIAAESNPTRLSWFVGETGGRVRLSLLAPGQVHANEDYGPSNDLTDP